jgi:hypothetical protein
MAQISNRSIQLFCWLFIVIGSVAVGVGGWMLAKSLRTEHWPVTNGIVRSSHTESHSDNDGGTTYSAEVAYTYQVAGVNYDGDKVSIGQMSASSDYAQGIANRYPAGRKVFVHYSSTNPAEAVLESGIHGGTWICLGVGTAFVLFGAMFLQIQKAAAKAKMPGAPQSSSIKTNPDGSISMDKPPVLMGVIFVLAGVGLCFVPPDSDKPNWIMYAVGGFFGLMGIFLLLNRLENKMHSKIAMIPGLVLFLAIFHWVSFGPGERIGTSTTPFSQHSGVDVRWPFAIFTILMDLVIVAMAIHWLFKRDASD